MNKKQLCKAILETVDNARFMGSNEEEVIEAIGDMVDTLEPKDRERFAAWGYPDQKTTPEKCWD